MSQMISAEPCTAIDYVAIVDPLTLAPASTLVEAPTVALLAVRVGKTRLIDNSVLTPPGASAIHHRLLRL